ncbi:uncharacterized protein LOC114770655 isoform X2 [Denticeps clupeoides]|uniref:Uncharacterized protein n=2 Tax=Denticeps clupeoides TaxID=299321 RepID=A0AAY4E684_9TELE|nr:uncharacterized protein LOC114770655 isoform X2 [Denticeps clupeoides]
MDKELNSGLGGHKILGISNELRDETFDKLVVDFLGSQTGEGLHLDEKPCKNRLLVQVGLLQEDKNAPWGDVIKWLQKIFPMFQSAAFQCLIERSVDAALSLTGGAREAFLDSDVNFEFVGPICDSIGIGRIDLLQMSAFSDRVACTEVTNGLVLELYDFIMREKVEPIVLVSWLQNFHPQFCSDGRIMKANRLLKPRLKKLLSHYRTYQRSRYRRNGLIEQFLQSHFDLSFGIAVKRSNLRGSNKRMCLLSEYGGRKPVGKVLKQDTDDSITSQSDSEYESIHPAAERVTFKGEDVLQDGMVEEECDPQWNEPSKMPNQSFDAANREWLTLLDVSILSVRKLSTVQGGKAEVSKHVSLELLKNQYTSVLMGDGAMKKMNDLLNALIEAHSLILPLDFLHYNTHFLLDISDAIEHQMMSFEREIVNATGAKLGRDNNPAFHSLVNFAESATCRYIQMASEILSPHASAKKNCRRHWLAFCVERNNPSKLPASVSERFSYYFEAAAALLHHRADVVLFFSDLQLLNDDPNIVLESVNDDAVDETIQALVCVLAVVYCKVLGPYWQLLTSRGQYVQYSRYMYCLYRKLLQWSNDASPLMLPEPEKNVFLQVPLQETTFDGVFSYCGLNAENQYGVLIKTCLQKIMKVLAAVMEENLKSFLPGGTYFEEPSSEVTSLLQNYTFSDLMGEYPFGHDLLYQGQRQAGQVNRVSASHTSTGPKDKAQQEPCSLPSTISEEKDQVSSEENVDKTMQESTTNDSTVVTVDTNQGPCKSKQDVDRLLAQLEGASHARKREAIRGEIAHQKGILDSSNRSLNQIGFSLADMVAKLKSVLPNEEGHSEASDTQATAGYKCPVALLTSDAEGQVDAEEQGSASDRKWTINLERQGPVIYTSYRENMGEFQTDLFT